MIYGIITGLILFGQGVGFKIYGKKASENNFIDNNTINRYNFIFSALITIIIASFTAYDLQSTIYGLVQGVMLFCIITLYGMAIKGGKIAFCNFVMAITMLMPIAFGAIAMGETLTWVSYIGLALFFLAAYFVCSGEKKNEKKIAKKYYIYIFISGIISGLQSVWLKYTSYVHEGLNSFVMLAACFMVASVFAIIMNVVQCSIRKRNPSALPTTFNKASATKYDYKWAVIAIIILALTTAFGNLSFITFQAVADASIFFPLANGLPLLLAVVVSPIFKEKISTIALIGVVLGLVAIVLLNI